MKRLVLKQEAELPKEVVNSLEVLRTFKGQSTVCGQSFGAILYRIHNRHDLRQVGAWYDEQTEEDQSAILRHISRM